MKKILTAFSMMLLLAALSTGCQTSIFHNKGKKTMPVMARTETVVDHFQKAKLLQESGDYMGALVEYRQVSACSNDPVQRDLAKIGAAECLLKTNKYPAALVALEPLPLTVSTEVDARRLALAGEILLRQHRHEEAKAYLEIALNAVDLETYAEKAQCDDPSLDVAAWIPSAAANLGCACVKLDQPEHGMVMYQFAAMMYRARGEQMSATKAQRMYDDLAEVLRQYAPFKPVPVVKGFPAGRM